MLNRTTFCNQSTATNTFNSNLEAKFGTRLSVHNFVSVNDRAERPHAHTHKLLIAIASLCRCGDGDIRTRLPHLRRAFTVVAEAQNVVSRFQIVRNPELVIESDVRDPLTRAQPVAQWCRRRRFVAWWRELIAKPFWEPLPRVWQGVHLPH